MTPPVVPQVDFLTQNAEHEQQSFPPDLTLPKMDFGKSLGLLWVLECLDKEQSHFFLRESGRCGRGGVRHSEVDNLVSRVFCFLRDIFPERKREQSRDCSVLCD